MEFKREDSESQEWDELSSGKCPVSNKNKKSSSNGDTEGCYYHDYLQLDSLLHCQHPESEKQGQPAHDEHLFITVHQAHELWFKQIIYELNSVRKIFSSSYVSDEDLGKVSERLHRVVLILQSLQSQLTILESMSPVGFLEFRNFLYPASGFQSVQFRTIENMLGLRKSTRISYQGKSYCSYLSSEHADKVKDEEDFDKTLLGLVDQWLSRMPSIVSHGEQFWQLYVDGVSRMLDAEETKVKNSTLPQNLKDEKVSEILKSKQDYLRMFSQKVHEERKKDGKCSISFTALQAALFINVFKEEPVLHMANQLLTHLQEIDEFLTQWRYRHSLMVRRMLGIKSGTGGSSGYMYLRATANTHKIFQDLNTSSYLIPRNFIPNRKQIFG